MSTDGADARRRVTSPDAPARTLWRNPFRRVTAPPALPDFDPEELTAHKREWAQRQRASGGGGGEDDATTAATAPLFDHFLIVGLDAADAAAAEALLDADDAAPAALSPGASGGAPPSRRASATGGWRDPQPPALPPRVLWAYTSGGAGAPPPPPDAADFCFPLGVPLSWLPTTPSGAAALDGALRDGGGASGDDTTVFLMQTPTGAPLYGVCVYADDLLARPPSPARPAGAAPPPLSARGRSLSARRCYALVTRIPALAAHVAVLREVAGLERLDRVTGVVAADASPATPPPPRPATGDGGDGTPASSAADFATPAATLQAPGGQAPSPAARPSPLARASARVLAAVAAVAPPSTGRPVRELRAAAGRMEEAAAAAAEAAAAPVDRPPPSPRGGDDGDDASFHSASSGGRSGGGGTGSPPPPPPTTAAVVEAYSKLRPPPRGSRARFAPHPALPPVDVARPPAASADAEHDAALAWAVAATAAALPLDGLLTLLTAALLERPIVAFGGGGAAAAAAVLALRPLLRPLAWAGPLLPALPAARGGGLALLGAPVPVAAGVPAKTAAAAAAAAAAVRVNLYKASVALPAPLPALPARAALAAAAAPHHAALVAAAPHPCPWPPPSDAVATATAGLLAAVRGHVEGRILDGLAAASLTEVGPAGDRVTVLLRDAWLAGRPPRDAPFAAALAETQAFAVYTDIN